MILWEVTIFHVFLCILNRKGKYISEVAQVISPGTLLIHIKMWYESYGHTLTT